MRDRLESLYERELYAIRQLALEFARERPKIAERLFFKAESGESADPHVERLIQAFSFLTARVRLKIEDEFPELTDALLGVLYPHYLAPVPSMAVAQFALDPARGAAEGGFELPRGTRLNSREQAGVRFKFRTAYPVRLWPVQVANAAYVTAPFPGEFDLPRALRDYPAALAVTLTTRGGAPFSTLGLDSLRFHLTGDGRTVSQLYELIFNHAEKVVLRDPVGGAQAVLPAETALRAVGFDREEGLLPYPPQSFPGYRLLTEYFAFPQKFHFVDLHGFDAREPAGAGDRLEVYLLFRELPDPGLEGLASRVRAESLRLGCTPIVNLFSQIADPIRVTQRRAEYPVVPDVRHPDSYEVYSIDAVEGVDSDAGVTTVYEPYYGLRHGADAQTPPAYWSARREPSPRGSGSDVWLALVDPAFAPADPAGQVLNVRTTCTNRDKPGSLTNAGASAWGMQIEGQAPVVSPVGLVVTPTASSRPPAGQARWRLISHLALNHLSITDGAEGADALREILKLYDGTDTAATARQVAGLTGVDCVRTTARVPGGLAAGFCRGVEVTVEFDQRQYAGTGAFLFASVLERFLPLYASINSFTRLTARYRGSAVPFRRWPPRVGEQGTL